MTAANIQEISSGLKNFTTEQLEQTRIEINSIIAGRLNARYRLDNIGVSWDGEGRMPGALRDFLDDNPSFKLEMFDMTKYTA